MVLELSPSEFARALPLYQDAGLNFPLISAVTQQRQRGQVFVDDNEHPSSAFIVTDFGFTYLVGDDNDDTFAEGLAKLLAKAEAIKPKYLLWYSPLAKWQSKLDGLPDLARKRGRIRLNFRSDVADWLGQTIQTPAGFELRRVDRALIRKTEKLGVKLDSRFWQSADDFLDNGLGVCLTKDGEVVSLCYAAAIADGLAEVDVATDADFRQQGLASIVTKQFINECQAQGITPTWDCFDYNAGSIKLAQKLGFVEVIRYPFYSFNVPLELDKK